MKYAEASALVSAALDAPENDFYAADRLSDADAEFIRTVSDPDDVEFYLDYFRSLVSGGRRFIVGDDGDAYILQGARAYYLPVVSSVGDAEDDELGFTAL